MRFYFYMAVSGPPEPLIEVFPHDTLFVGEVLGALEPVVEGVLPRGRDWFSLGRLPRP